MASTDRGFGRTYRRWLVPAVLTAIGSPLPAAEWSAGAAITSDYVFRGISQTIGPAALQVWLEAEHEAGFYGSLWLSNVDLVPADAEDDGARLEADIAIGYAAELGEHWSLDVAAVRYVFPGTKPGVDYDYLEWIGTIAWRDNLRVTAGYSDGVFGESASGWYAETGATFPLPFVAGIEAGVVAGYYDLDAAFGESYRYWQLGIGRGFGAVRAALDWHVTSSSADAIFYAQSTGSRVALTLEWTLR